MCKKLVLLLLIRKVVTFVWLELSIKGDLYKLSELSL